MRNETHIKRLPSFQKNLERWQPHFFSQKETPQKLDFNSTFWSAVHTHHKAWGYFIDKY
jgi:hypothetical protein